MRIHVRGDGGTVVQLLASAGFSFKVVVLKTALAAGGGIVGDITVDIFEG